MGVGNTLTVTTGRAGIRPLRVVALLASRFTGEEAVISWREMTALAGPDGDDTVLVKARDGVGATAFRAAVDRVVASDPLLRVTSIASFKDQLDSAINRLLALFAGMLAVAVLIALFGIANTLSLTVLERTRKSALLQALGLTRGQLRRMLAGEALLMGLMGRLIGAAVGVGFGWLAAQTFIQSAGGGAGVSFPVGQIARYVMVAGLVRVVAAVVPTRRTARVPVVTALADT